MSYVITDNKWTVVSPVTYSFVPDGTDFGGDSSNLSEVFDPIGDWKGEVRKAFAKWADVAAIDFAEMTDDGSAFGVEGYQQGDSRFGDIRIGGIAQADRMATAFSPPPVNGGTYSGDFVFNTNLSWHINSSYDILTVALHEIGHSIGIGHSPDNSAAVMWLGYTGTKQTLQTDDINAVRAIYGTRGDDPYEANNSKATAYEIGLFNDGGVGAGRVVRNWIGVGGDSSIVCSSTERRLGPRAGIVQISDCEIKAQTDSDWYTQVIRVGNPGSLTVGVQSKYFSTLKPRMLIYDESTTLLADVVGTHYGDQISCTIEDQPVGSRIYVRVIAASTLGVAGRYGFLWNTGTAEMAEIPRPDVQVEEQEDGEGEHSSELFGMD